MFRHALGVCFFASLLASCFPALSIPMAETQMGRSVAGRICGLKRGLAFGAGAGHEGWSNFVTNVRRGMEKLNDSIQQKRIELRPWDKLASQHEEAFLHSQMWINPLYGWKKMQGAVFSAAALSKICQKQSLNAMERARIAFMSVNMSSIAAGLPFDISGGNAEPCGIKMQADVGWVNEQLVNTALELTSNNDGWEEVSCEKGVCVWKKFLKPDMRIAGLKLGKASQFAVIKAKGVINAPLEEVYSLFIDNARVHEYNEYCKEVEDLEWLDDTTKVTYSTTGRPWCRDFVTRVHYKTLEDQTKLVVNRGEEHKLAPRKKGYTRMEMSVGANMMRPLPEDPTKTEFTLLTHVNPGGMASSQFGAMITNKLSSESPKQFFINLNRVASKSPLDEDVHEQQCQQGGNRAAGGWRILVNKGRKLAGGALAAGSVRLVWKGVQSLAASGSDARNGRDPSNQEGLGGMFHPEISVGAAPSPA